MTVYGQGNLSEFQKLKYSRTDLVSRSKSNCQKEHGSFKQSSKSEIEKERNRIKKILLEVDINSGSEKWQEHQANLLAKSRLNIRDQSSQVDSKEIDGTSKPLQM